MVFAEHLLDFMREKAYKPMTEGELISALNIDPKETDLLLKTLNYLEKQGLVVKNRRGKYGVPEKMNLIVGKLEGHPGGYAFLLPDDPEIDDIYISREDMNGAMHGDRVLVRPKIAAKANSKVEGEVIRILQRALKTVVGTVERGKHFSFVVPDDKRIFYDLYRTKRQDYRCKKRPKGCSKDYRMAGKASESIR